MNEPITSPPNAPSEEALQQISTCLFVIIWGFPEPSQTFIQRELQHLARQGARVQVLAGHRVKRTDLDSVLEDIADRAMYLGPASSWLPRSLRYIFSNPLRFWSALTWSVMLPHRTLMHRFRMAGMLVIAASVAEEVVRRGVKYLHAHFAAYHTELAMALGRLTDLPYGFTAHATGIWKDRNLLATKIAGARLVMTCTAYNAEHLRSLAPYHADTVHLVYHGLDLDDMPEARPAPRNGSPRFLAIGRLVPKKGLSYLIDAVAQLRERGLDAHLTILGDGPERPNLVQQVRDRDLGSRVHLPGAVSNHAVWKALEASHALVTPSIRAPDGNLDGIPNVILEAMAMRRPVIASRISGIPEVVRPDETGMLVEPENVLALADAMEVLVRHPDTAAEMGRRGREFVRQHFDVRENAARQLALLSSALDEGGRDHAD